MHLRNAAAAAIMTTAALAAVPAAAHAGTYTVESCTDRGGGPGLAVGDSEYGWQASVSPTAVLARNDCALDGGRAQLLIALPSRYTIPYTEGGNWIYKAPPETSITGYDLWWKGYGTPGTSAFIYPGYSPRYNGVSWGDGNDAGAAVNRVSRTGIDQQSIQVTASCSDASGCPGDNTDGTRMAVNLYRSVVRLADTTDPDVAAGGEAVSSPTWTGSVALRVTGSDTGGGVYRALVSVDGGPADVVLVDPQSTRCKPLYADAPFTFQHPRPCSTSISRDVALDTTTFGEGAHRIVVRVQDAASNDTTVLDATRTIDNRAPVVGEVGLTGIARDGDDLSCGASVDGQSAQVAYQWVRAAADGSGAAAISGATNATYRLTESDVGRKLICRLTATDAGGSTTRSSSITQPPFDNGAVVRSFCSGRPTGAQDPCGDRDADGIVNAKDPSPDPTGSDAGPAPGRPGTSTTTKESSERSSSETLIVERGAANGDNAADDARLTAFFDPSNRSRSTIPFGRRAVIAGKLTDARGAAITSARIEVVTRTALAEAAWLDQPSVATRSDGTFNLVVPKGVSSRSIALRYRAHVRDDKPAAVASVDLAVRAGVSLRITPKVSRNRGTIRFRGALLGKPVPVRGKLVELQARAKGMKKWITFRTVRATRRGSFGARYTFRATYGAITYEFRARARQEGSYPFLTGASRVVRVRVR